MSKQINLVINGRGGVGKSFFATNFGQYLVASRHGSQTGARVNGF
jgi:MinD-like ATPase involved in chromosome partitioning or flagellar assembly